MNRIFIWLKKHPSIELDLHTESSMQYIIFTMRIRGTNAMVRQAFTYKEIEQYMDEEFILDMLFDEISRFHSGTMELMEA